MFTRDQTAPKCAQCRYWELKYSDASEHGELGECRRFPPTICESIQIASLGDYERESLRYKSEEDRFLDWQKKQDEKYSTLRSRMDRIEESINTSTSERQVDHWIAEREKHQKKIDALLTEEYDRAEWWERDESTFWTRASRGRWLLTSADEVCGEWKQK